MFDGADPLGGGCVATCFPGDMGIACLFNKDFMETVNLFLSEPVSLILNLMAGHSGVRKDFANINKRVMPFKILKISFGDATAVNGRVVVHKYFLS